MNISFFNPPSRRPRRTMSGLQCLLLLVLALSCTFSAFSRAAHAAPGDISTVAGTGVAGFSGDNGAATAATLSVPLGVATDKQGNFFIADYNNNCIRKVDAAGIITTVAGGGPNGLGDGSPATSARIFNPTGMTVDSAGNLFIAEFSGNRVRKVDTAGIISTVAGGGANNIGDGGPATSAQLFAPTNVVIDSAGNLLISDQGNKRIRKVDAAGIISTIAGGGNNPGDGGQATSAQVSNPTGIAVDRAGNLFIAETGSNRIRKVDAAGIITTVAGGGNNPGDGGPATSALVNFPYGIAVDNADNLFIASRGGNRIRKVDAAGIISTVAGGGANNPGDGGPATSAQLNNPAGVAVNNGGDLLIADANNNRIRRVENIAVPAPAIASFAPTRGPIGSTVVISGTGFVNVTAVAFSGTPASSFTVDSATQISATVPSGNATGKISVTTPGGTVVSADDFTVTETPSLIVNTVADNSTDVDGLTSLREAINRAGSDGVASTITFDATAFAAPRKTITLNGTQLPDIIGNNTLTISAPVAGVEISGNNASRVFVVNSDADVTLTGLTIRDGNVGGSFGGGILNAGKLTLDSCTLTGNRARLGGAITSRTNLSDLTLTLRNCTLSGNTTTSRGGGLYNLNGLNVIESCTIVGNEAPAGEGGGMALFGDSDTRTEVRNSIIAGNTGSDVELVGGTSSSFQSKGYNLIGVGDATGAFNASGDVINNTAPGVAALADNLGRVPTIALLPGSPAINAGDPAFNGTGQFDGRGPGFARIVGGRLDIGAFEVQNSAPTVKNFSVTLDEDTTFTFAADSFDGGFSDPDAGNTLQSVRIETLPANGTLNYNGNAATVGQIVARADLGKLSFVPAADFNGQTSFDFNASDGTLYAPKSARLTLNVTSVNDAPMNSVPGPQSTDEDTALIIDDGTRWSPNGISVDDSDNATLTLTLSVEHGALTLSQTTRLTFAVGDGTSDATMTFSGDKGDINAALSGLIYAPDANFNGSDTLTVTSNDGTLSDKDSVAITVAAVNDAPIATDSSATTDEDTAVTIDIKPLVSDVETGDTDLIYALVAVPAAAQGRVTAGTKTGTFVFTPAPDFNGSSSFTYRVTDTGDPVGTPGNVLSSDIKTITVTVNAVNDAPSFLVGANQSVNEDAPAQSVAKFATGINAGAPDESAQTLTFDVTNDNAALFAVAPAIATDGTLTYTLATNVTGSATVSVTLNDNGGGANASGARTFAITVTANPILFGVSISPKAPLTNDTLTATPVILDGAGVSYAYEWFVNGVSVQKGASNTLDLSKPGQGDKGDRISVTATAQNNRGGLGSATNEVTVRNSAPFAFSGTASAQSGVETRIAFKPFGNPGGADSDGENLTYKRVGGPQNGTATFESEADGSIVLRYTSRRGFVGVEAIRFVAVDELGRTSNVATLGIDVKGTPLVAPTAQNASASATAGTRVDVPVVGTDPNGGPVTFKRVGGPTNGTGEFVKLGNGTTVLRYQSRAGFAGIEEVRFVALNADGRSSGVATIRIRVSPSNASALQTGNAPSAGNS